MCLYDRKFRITLRKRKCYKILSKNPWDPEDTYRSPCQNTKVVIKTGETELIPEDPSAKPRKVWWREEYQFEEGFIYYFTDFNAAKNYSNYISNPVIFEGYIPAFTRYAKEDVQECARKVILTKKLCV